MIRTTQDLINAVTREPQRWWIKVVRHSHPNEDGRWIDCGYHQFPSGMKYRESVQRLAPFCPFNHHIVSVLRHPHSPES